MPSPRAVIKDYSETTNINSQRFKTSATHQHVFNRESARYAPYVKLQVSRIDAELIIRGTGVLPTSDHTPTRCLLDTQRAMSATQAK